MKRWLGNSITWRYALRSLGRHKRRSALSVVGVGLGVAVSLLMISWVYGEGETMKRAAANSGVGHFRLAPAKWLATRDNKLRLANSAALLTQVRADSAVLCAAPHARTEALLAMGTRTAGVELVGVDPTVEPTINRLVRAVTRGRYLQPGDGGRCVIGAGVAKRLKVDVGDHLLITASGAGEEMRSAMLEVVGVVKTGSTLLDTILCQVLLEDIDKISGYPGPAEISVLLHDVDRAPEIAAVWNERLPADTVAVSWEQLVPELADGVEVDKGFARLIVAVIVVVVFLGIASSQLAAVLERRKEFAVLAALGMKGHQLVGALIAESLLLGGAGGVLALTIGLPGVYYIHTEGVDLRHFIADFDLGISNILLEPIVHGSMGWWILPLAVGLSLCATVLGSLYPAWYALSTNPANALRAD